MHLNSPFLLGYLLTLIIIGTSVTETIAQWQVVGSRNFTSGNTTRNGKSLTTVNGSPFVAYIDNANNSKLKVTKFDGTNWVDVGPTTLPTGPIHTPNIANNNGVIYVAYQDLNASRKNSVIKFDGTNWTYVGSPGFSPDEARFQSIAFYNGEPYVAFEDKNASYESSVMKFNGTNWVYVGSSGFTTGYSAGQSVYNKIAFNDSIPYVIYVSVASNPTGPPIAETKVMKFKNSTWMPVGGTTGYNNAGAGQQSIAFLNGEPYFSFLDWNHFKATVKKFDGNNWVNIGTAGFSSDLAPDPQIAINNGIPYIAYRDFGASEKLTVMRYDGSNWVPVGGTTGVSPSKIIRADISIDNNVIYVAFVDTINPNSGKLTVMSYNIVNTSLEKMETMNKSFQIYPNPVTNLLTIKTEDEVEYIAVLTMNGQELLRTKSQSIKLDTLPQGMYLIQIKTKKSIGYKRFTKT
ncbi:MAG: T9SS type A sorting domain-containing protein [Aureispira sp.]|nr:T9SS type A sorting domain-containing protein [Aureispira sp.]